MLIFYNGINIYVNNIILKIGKRIKMMKWYVFVCNEEFIFKDVNEINIDKNGVYDSLIVFFFLLVIIYDI